MRTPPAVVGMTVALCLAAAGCEGIVDGKRAHLPLVLALQLGDGPRVWTLDSVAVTVEGGGERQEVRRPVNVGVDSWQFAFDVPDEALEITASVTSTRRASEETPGGIELLRGVYQGGASDLIDLTLEPVAPILVVELERTAVSSGQPALFLVHNLGVGQMAWNVAGIVPGNTCFVVESPAPCLVFEPGEGVLGPNATDSLEVALWTGDVRSYGFQIDSPTGAVGAEVSVTSPPRADLEVRLVYPSGGPAAQWEVEVEGPLFRVGVTDANGRVLFPDLPLGNYFVSVPFAEAGQSVLLPGNGAHVLVTLTVPNPIG